jgi:molybdate/tungstate transport system substrate-binding protein
MLFQLAGMNMDNEEITYQLAIKDRHLIRPKEVDLLAMLDLKELDFIFIYKSVAVQHGLKYLELPDLLNLADPANNNYYFNAEVRIKGQAPGNPMTIHGEAIIYAVTMLKNAPNPKAAEAFLLYLVNKEKGMKILEESGHNSIESHSESLVSNLPEFLQSYISKQ